MLEHSFQETNSYIYRQLKIKYCCLVFQERTRLIAWADALIRWIQTNTYNNHNSLSSSIKNNFILQYTARKKGSKYFLDWFSPRMIDWLIFLCRFFSLSLSILFCIQCSFLNDIHFFVLETNKMEKMHCKRKYWMWVLKQQEQ